MRINHNGDARDTRNGSLTSVTPLGTDDDTATQRERTRT